MKTTLALLSAFISVLAFSGVLLTTTQSESDISLESSQIQDLREQYEQWKIKNSKYTNSRMEDQYRFQVWLENLETVISTNKKQSSYKLGMTKFADLTKTEFAYLHLMKNDQAETQRAVLKAVNDDIQKNPDAYIKGNVDYRNKGVLNAVQNQGSCGSCYSFAAAASLEAAYVIQTQNNLVKFSEQNIVSCSQPYGNDGCDGGFGYASFDFVQAKGITTLEKYPYYSGEDGVVKPCAVSQGEYFINSYNHITGLGNCLGQQTVNQEQPLYARADANGWHLYESGVFDGNGECSDDPAYINHGITIVGYNTENSDESKNYWIIRNSWGSDWGQDGYMYLKFGNTCAICHDAYAPLF